MSKRSNHRRSPSTSSSGSVDSEEEARRRDLQERDAFSKRLKARDETKTRNIVEASTSKKSFEEAAKRSKMEAEDRDKLMPQLRLQSRRQYLAKRKEDKVAELEADILDDEYLFNEDVLTEREKEERAYKKKLLSIAKDHEKARDLERVQRYHMPQDVKKGEKYDYVEVDEREKLPNSEQKKWEAEQLASAVFKFGAKDKDSAKQQEEYELLLDDQIEFIQALTIEGTKEKKDGKKKEPELTESERKKMSIAETKKLLPVYPFRDDLIAAIHEHQVRGNCF